MRILLRQQRRSIYFFLANFSGDGLPDPGTGGQHRGVITDVPTSWRSRAGESFSMDEHGNDIVVFRHYDNAINANIAKTKLDAYGIPCFLTEENMANLYPGLGLNAFRIRLHLFATDRDRAAQLLAGENLSVIGDAVTCPLCHSPKIAREFPKKLAESLTFIFFGVFLPHRKVNHCVECDYEF